MEKKNQQAHINVDFFEDLTGDILKEKQKNVKGVGNKIRTIREAKSLSLEDLAKITGFEVDLLAKIEKNEVQPQLGTIMKLSKALDSAFSRLLSDLGDKFYSVTRKNEQTAVVRSTSQKGKKQVYTYKTLAPDVKGKHMEALIVELEENPKAEMSVHDGEEFIYVLNGCVALTIGEDSFDLEPGDSVYYLSTIPHRIASKHEKASILAVLYGD